MSYFLWISYKVLVTKSSKKNDGSKIICKKGPAVKQDLFILALLGHYWDTFTGETIVYQRFNK